jgi:hypothetical protein
MRKIYKIVFKNLTAWLFVLPVVFLLYGCPYSSAFKIDSDPTIPVEDTLIGKWSTATNDANGKSLSIKMIIDKKNDYEYNIDFTGNVHILKRYVDIKNDTIRTTAFISEVGARRFLNIHLFEQYYIVELIYKDDKISLLPLCEHFTSRLIKNDAEIRSSLEQHYKTRLYPLYDDEFCLREMIRVQ